VSLWVRVDREDLFNHLPGAAYTVPDPDGYDVPVSVLYTDPAA